MKRQQLGMGLISLVVVIALCASAALLLIRIGPYYLQDWSVKQSMEAMATEDESRQKILSSPNPKASIKNTLQRYFSVNRPAYT